MLTRSGLGALIVAVVALLCGLSWHYRELVVIAVVVIGLLIASLISVRTRLPAEFQRFVDAPRVARGDPINARYVVINDTRLRIPPLTIVDKFDNTVTAIGMPSVPAHEREQAYGHHQTRRRGVFDVGPAEIQRVDAFGVAVGRRQESTTNTVIVHPRLYPLERPYGTLHSVTDEANLRTNASDPLSGFVSLREYADGDDPRLIHWPTSARMGTLMLREHVELRRPEFTVIADAAGSVATEDDFEEIVDVAASIAVHALRNAVHVRVRTTSKDYAGSPRPIERDTQVLDFLTPVQQVGLEKTLPMTELFGSLNEVGKVAFVTGPNGPSSAIRNFESVSIFRIGKGATTEPGIELAADNAADFSQRWRQ